MSAPAPRRSPMHRTNKFVTTDPTNGEWKRMIAALRLPGRVSHDLRRRLADKLEDYAITNSKLTGPQPGIR